MFETTLGGIQLTKEQYLDDVFSPVDESAREALISGREQGENYVDTFSHYKHANRVGMELQK